MADACCETLLDVSHLQRRQKRVLWTVLGINVATFLMMFGGGVLSRSTAVLSGGLDNFGDALTYGLSLAVVGRSVTAQARVAAVKGVLILLAAAAVAAQVVWRLLHPGVPVFEAMGLLAVLNLGANAVCLAMLTPYRRGDVNMASAWHCSRNDVWEGVAVIAAALAVGLLGAGWPDLVVAAALLLLFVRSGTTVLREAWAAR